MDKQSYLIRPRDRILNFCLSLSLFLFSSFPIGPSCFHVRTNSLPFGSIRGSNLEIFRDRFFYFFFFLHLSETRSCCDGFITMPTDKYWSKGNIGSKQVFQVVVIKKRGVGSKFFSTRFLPVCLLMKFCIFLLVCTVFSLLL